ncbi:MAG: transglycosylase domain-containing protein [Methylococcales bacterium]|nr:transglycosylase domain-containing protein [Methylococcales bacterium]
MKKKSRIVSRLLLTYTVIGSIAVTGIAFKLVKDEVQLSRYQARYLSEISKQISFKLENKASNSIRYPNHGPYDRRLGYTLLSDQIDRLEKEGFGISAQATASPMMTQLMDEYGLFPLYHEKNQAGLRLVDNSDKPLFAAAYPTYGYPNFDVIPPVILNTLLYIENRELLNENRKNVNPAVEWDRLGFAVLQMMAKKLGVDRNVPGGSTLATQIEKYRHSPNGYTESVYEKIRQMASASIRAYLLGVDTREMRRQIALAYLNTMPLAASEKSGEVHGLGDGLVSWFGADFKEINNLLASQRLKDIETINPEQAKAYRQVLSILLSQRRPTYLLGAGFESLQTLTDSYLRLLATQGVISNALRDAALAINVERVPKSSSHYLFVTEQKTQNVLRARLAQMLDIKTNYDLDRLDLTVKSTINSDIQKQITTALKKLSDPINARSAGLIGERMLSPSNDLSSIIYSLVLFERSNKGNLLRVQTDNYDQPLDINEGIRLDLGSTAKLRTLVHYLELIGEIYETYQGQSPQLLAIVQLHPRDFLSTWVVDELKARPKITLSEILEQALERKYSASPDEYFYTGGGVHHFNNFSEDDDIRILSVRNALRNSVNLVFIRMMRDLTYHHLYKPEGIARWLENPDDLKRAEYLSRFADREGLVYLRRFYARYKGKSTDDNLEVLTQKVYPKPSRLTMLYEAIYPERDRAALEKYLKEHIPIQVLVSENIDNLFYKYTSDNFDLQDQGYITKVHPLELWVVKYLSQHPDATREEVIEASAEERQNVYQWLFKHSHSFAQQRRIMTLLEDDAFKQIHAAWERVGYPFASLTPSYATSIGASGDRPAALADLIGIISNNGVKLPSVRFANFHYAKATPYETILDKTIENGQQILSPEVARAARSALIGVVASGTAVAMNGIYKDANGKWLEVGGKTGTGDHRKEKHGTNGQLLESKFISRAATFTFFLGDKFFGVITAYVAGDNAGSYHFTSSLPVHILRFLEPTLSPMLNQVSAEPIKSVVAPTVEP